MSNVRMMTTGVLLIGALGAGAGAQRPMRGMQPPQGGRMMDNQQPPGGRRMMGPGPRGGRASGMGPAARAQLLRGITLSDDQKTRMRSVQENYRTQLQSTNTQRRIDALSVQQARLKGDTGAMHAARAKVLSDGDRAVALRAQAMDGVRASLTPEQQKQFDVNRSRVRSQALWAARARRMNNGQGIGRGAGPQRDMQPPLGQGRGRGMMPQPDPGARRRPVRPPPAEMDRQPPPA